MQRRPSSFLFLLLLLTGCVPSGSTPADPGEADGGQTDSDNEPEEQAIRCDGYNEADYPEEPATFSVDGNRAIMAGYITSTTPAAVDALLADNPNLELIIMPFVPGSEDDDANLEAARAVHEAGVATCVPAEGLIASGGVDFFLAGSKRGAGQGARLGVHSWAAGDGLEGGDLPKDHPDHVMFLEYYADIGIEEAFYWFTLEAAPAAGIHWMSPAEMETYGVLTQ